MLFLLIACHHRSGAEIVVLNRETLATPSVSLAEPSPYDQCPGEFLLNLQGSQMEGPIAGWVNGELVYTTPLLGQTHYVSCMVDFQCENPQPVPRYAMYLPPHCMDYTKCCDLGAVTN